MKGIAFDIQYAVRRLLHTPAFSIIVILTLALGIGANSAIFSVVNTVLLRPMPYYEPDRIVEVYHWYPDIKLHAGVSAPGLRAYRDEANEFEYVGAAFPWKVNLTGIGDPERLRGAQVSGDYFRALGVAAAQGRTFRTDEDAPGHEHEVVISDGLWKRLLAGAPDALGKSMSLNGEPFTIIGIMPPQFVDPWQRDAEIWSPMALPVKSFEVTNFTNEFMQTFARLKPGITVEQAKKDMEAFAEQLKKRYPNQFAPTWTLGIMSLRDARTGAVKGALLVLLGAVGVVLLIACANVANLLLARAAARQKEVAIRTALGAERWALMRQLLVESVILSVVGGALGLFVADASMRTLVAINPQSIPGAADLTIDGTVLLFTFLLAVTTGVLFGIVPAIQASRSDLNAVLKEGSRGSTDRAGQTLRRSLVVAEIALALTLLAGGGLMLRSFARLTRVDPGFDPSHVLTFDVSLPQSQYPNDTAQRAFFARLMPRLAEVPGVVVAGGTTVMPFGGGWGTSSFMIDGYDPPKGQMPWGDVRIITPGFFAALKMPLIAGRDFEARDDRQATNVVIVDDELVRRYYKNDPAFAVGHRLYFGGREVNKDPKLFATIVGVAPHSKQEGLDAENRVQVYIPVGQINFSLNTMDVAVRTKGDPLQSVSAVREALLDVDRNMPMATISSLERLVDRSLGQRRLGTVLLGTFAGLALLLAALGVYGVMSYAVAQRTREIGVRVALGASRRDVVGLVVGQGARIAGMGAGIGLVGALTGAYLLRAKLFGVGPSDPVTLISITLILSVSVLVASAIPALRAASIHPTEALREE
jgi:putative ABC transport system permease protein